jgi:hypothetical protein
MQYKYRWYYAAGIMLIVMWLSLFYFIIPKWDEAAALLSTEEQLTLNLTAIKQFASQHHEEVINNNLQPIRMAELVALGHTSGVTVQSINLLARQPLEAAHMNIIQMVVSGDFTKVVQFIYAITYQRHLSAVTDFLYKVDHHDEGNLFNLNLMLSDDVTRFSSEALPLSNTVMHNPFCFTANEAFQQNDPTELQQVPLNQIKMVGYLRQGDRVVGIVALPSGAVFDVRLADILGLEHGVVKKIERYHIVVERGGKQNVYSF